MNTSFFHRFWSSKRRLLGVLGFLLWVLTMIAQPIVRWVGGEAALQRGIVIAVLVQVFVVLAILWQAWGWRNTLLRVLLILLLSWLVEALGSATGFPFGAYRYTQALQPQVGGVPVLIPLAWLMMLPPAWAIGSLIARHAEPSAGFLSWDRLKFTAVSALAFTAWDLFLDPQMVQWQFWIWLQPGAYFGIPLQNYLGWLVVSGLLTLMVRPSSLPLAPLAAVYAITWMLQFIGQLFFWGLPGPALVGFLGMGAMLGWASLRSADQEHSPFAFLRRWINRRRGLAWRARRGA